MRKRSASCSLAQVAFLANLASWNDEMMIERSVSAALCPPLSWYKGQASSLPSANGLRFTSKLQRQHGDFAVVSTPCSPLIAADIGTSPLTAPPSVLFGDLQLLTMMAL